MPRTAVRSSRLRIPALLGLGLAVAVAVYLRAGSPPRSITNSAPPAAVHYTYRVVRTYPHDPGAFTQGLIFRDGYLFESTGLNGQSRLRKVRLETGQVVQEARVADEHFAEGLTAWHDQLIQLTWQSHLGFVYDLPTFSPRRTFAYPWDGWGLTQDGSRLIFSDGSDALRFLDPVTFQENGHVRVTDNGQPVDRLNELEFIKGSIYANVWQTDRIAIIAPGDGHVTGWIDLAGLRPTSDGQGPIDVLNGIAYDATGDRLFVTGKLWPALFEITIGPL
ncbi:MAG: glutaminyl-peptide cyclotransferase [Acidobacteriota bacterium]